MGKIEDYVKTLTSQEKAQYRNLIQECLERQEFYSQVKRESQKRNKEFGEEITYKLIEMQKSLEYLPKLEYSVRRLKIALQNLKESNQILNATQELAKGDYVRH